MMYIKEAIGTAVKKTIECLNYQCPGWALAKWVSIVPVPTSKAFVQGIFFGGYCD
tara:strand:+ start:296 stop:460 length:165 start_codon:yes stop_codon:yes gene_type:complete